ncbi:hypothetical protein F383_35344 [Gossypium arboreum]|uniref:Transmembrane protein n=1 Tax=Gossypium arboreum TaxID=29729 RepID=A0A0B0N7L6_GOSAR|nr:hypothetical protein F383_35344 [Gossypium arboreum]
MPLLCVSPRRLYNRKIKGFIADCSKKYGVCVDVYGSWCVVRCEGVAVGGYGGWGCYPVVAQLLLGLGFAKIWFSIWAVWARALVWVLG